MKHCFSLIIILQLCACSLLRDWKTDKEDISDFKGQAIQIALLESKAENPEDQSLFHIIAADLERSGRFHVTSAILNTRHPLQSTSTLLQDWSNMGVDYLLVANNRFSDNRLETELQLWDSRQSVLILTLKDRVERSELRAHAHQVSDQVFKSILDVEGPFSSKLLFITSETTDHYPRYHLWLADADGYNRKELLSSEEPIMSPTWSPDAGKIVFASLQAQGKQQLYIHELDSARTHQVKLDKPGLIGAPAWSPDGERLSFTLIYNGNADIYTFNLNNRELNRLTCHRAIDTESTWSPDGMSIVFTSDRSGRPQLYEIPASGGRAKRITYHGRENAQASISPNGKQVAMLHNRNGKYRIALLDRKTGDVSVLTDGELDESPKFSMNGSMIVFSSSMGNNVALSTISVNGRNKQRLSIYQDIRDPVWSPTRR